MKKIVRGMNDHVSMIRATASRQFAKIGSAFERRSANTITIGYGDHDSADDSARAIGFEAARYVSGSRE
jgi:hypothetical protein